MTKLKHNKEVIISLNINSSESKPLLVKELT